jgi:hypothetical protein
MPRFEIVKVAPESSGGPELDVVVVVQGAGRG